MRKILSRIALTGIAATTLVLAGSSAATAGGCGGFGGYGFGGSFYNANQSAAGPQGAANTNLCTGTNGGYGLW
ncbi:hypothetical protein GCM10010466_45300 [Planomonospora alba]|uniref:Uncharacterized protein n=1 Tax=Planomonospora alba TaxID=161354 RepID=A0ABP6NIW1_9ACTN